MMDKETEISRPSFASRIAVSEMIQLQRRLFERQHKIIEANEAHSSKGFKRYRNEYRKAVSGYMAESGFGALCDAIGAARVAFVADYHTLPLAQRTFVKLIKGVMHQVDNICLAMEFVHERHQDALDLYVKGKIKERAFLSRIDYKKNWPYDIWPSFKPIFELAMDNGFPVIAIDSASSYSLKERDLIAAARIAKASKRFPDATILVFAGQMHMAPSHLPAAVDKAFAKAGLSSPERVIVYQNAEEIYWQLAHERREGIEVVQVDQESYCVNNTPPLVQQLSYLHWVQFDRDLLEYTELESTLRSLIQSIGQFLDLDVRRAADELKVLMPGDLDLMDILETGDFGEEEKQLILAHIEEEESTCIPKLNLIYLANLSVNHAAEEATHYIKHAVSGGTLPENPRDRFYYLVLNEAAGFFGSKVINPKRKTDHQGKLRRTVAQARNQTKQTAEETAAAFVLDHQSWESGRRSNRVAPKSLADPKVFNAASHMLGYILGDRLFYGLTTGIVSKSTIRDLFLAPLDGPGDALDLYLRISEKVRAVKVPRRI